MIDGIVSDAPWEVEKQQRPAKWLLNAPVSHELRTYLRAFLWRLHEVNPHVDPDKPQWPGTLRSRTEWEEAHR